MPNDLNQRIYVAGHRGMVDSRDATVDILLRYQANWSQEEMIIRDGPQTDLYQKSLSLAFDPQIREGCFTTCYQDGVWFPEKLTANLQAIAINQSIYAPFVYCGLTVYVTDDLKACGFPPLFKLPTSFVNTLVQSIACGKTKVFNLVAKLLIEKAGALNAPSDDWRTYLLISIAGGDVFYKPVPYIMYRQNDGALMGGNKSFPAKLQRVIMLLQGRFQGWNAQNIAALKDVKDLLTKNHQEILSLFELLRGVRLKERFRLVGIFGFYRQTRRGTLSFFPATLLKNI
jgi:hypothetical protein